MKALTALFMLIVALPATADQLKAPRNPLYQEECAACHLAFPPQLLDAHSWLHLMNGLEKHFGTDASLDASRRTAIVNYLGQHAGGRKIGMTSNAGGQPLTRITETAYFQRKHRKIEPATYQRSSIKSAANCTSCHRGAAEGDYEEDRVRIPS
jgi:hypothetical protein